jgi:hypothetical protein
MTKPEVVDAGSDELYVRRNEKGQFKESDDLAALFLPISAEGQKPKQGPVRATGGIRKVKH